MEHEFFLVEGLAQLILQGELAGHRFSHFLGVKQITIAAPLGFFERCLGVLEQSVGGGTVIREQRHSDLGGDSEYGVIQVERMVQKSFHGFLESPRNFFLVLYFR